MACLSENRFEKIVETNESNQKQQFPTKRNFGEALLFLIT